MNLRRLVWFSVCLFSIVQPAHAQGNTHALLIGVSEYPSLKPERRLVGPANDVRAYRDLLIERGVDTKNIVTVADGVSGGALPTRDNIIASLDTLSTRVQPGDFVFLLVSAHGSQQPAPNGVTREEPDGQDEIILPRDVKSADGELDEVKNVIVDNEFGAYVERMRARGAFVWAVFDTCHSGTALRGARAADERDREVPPTELGIRAKPRMQGPKLAVAPERTTNSNTVARKETGEKAVAKKGGLVAFYAAQSNETAPEALLPRNAEGAAWRGLLSFHLQQAWTANPTASYRQIMEQVLQRYQARGKFEPTPTYDGDSLDAVVFGSEAAPKIKQWGVEKKGGTLRIRGGLAQDLTKDSILAVVPKATAADTEVLGYVRVTQSTAVIAEVEPVEYNERARLDVAAIPSAAYARAESLKVDFALRVALPRRSGECATPRPAVENAIAKLKANEQMVPRVTWVAHNEAAEVRLCEREGRLKLLDGSGTVSASSSVAGIDLSKRNDGELLASELAGDLNKISRVINLSRVAERLGAGNRILQVSAKLLRCGNHAACDPDDPHDKPISFDSTARLAVRTGDLVQIELYNPNRVSVDVTVLSIDPLYEIVAQFPNEQDLYLPRIGPNERKSFDLELKADAPGLERLLIIAVPAGPNNPIVSFADLTQDGVSKGLRKFTDLFEEAVFGSEPQAAYRAERRARMVDGTDFMSFGWKLVSP